ncbi:MAG: pilus assembly protein N-terminal domain-containing protein [Deltaproteobacteria bacterium]|nr:pilus assembly protein N-terminal domain-containing protein [Deltaproteobacteria bacterium]MBI3295965.1 pilus assembly protein N-terminal domain-containing protein [Deltaproteobacteria bacterium]
MNMCTKRRFSRLAVVSVCLLFSLPLSVAAPASAAPDLEDEIEVKTPSVKQKNLTLALGISRTLELTFDIGNIELTDPNLFKYKRVPEAGKERKLLFTPQNAGVTDMTIRDTTGKARVNYTVRVTREDVGQTISQLEELMGDVEGIKFRSVAGTVIIDGEILLPKDMARIMRVLDAIKDRDPKKKEIPIKNLATISKTTMNIIAERIEREIGSPEVTARVLNNIIMLEGTAENNFEADRAVEIAKTYLPETFAEVTKGPGGEVKVKDRGGFGGPPGYIDLLRVRPAQNPPPPKDVKITMNYVELNNEYEKTFNFEWRPLASDNSTIKYDSSLGELTANLVATINSLFPKLVTAKSHGHARVLKQETLIVKDRSDQPAAIESSIDFYSRIVNEKGEASLQPISVQNVTKVKASSLAGTDSVELGIQISLNSLLGTNQGAPIIAKNSLQTQVTIKNGDSAALGGFAVDQALSGYNREPTRQVTGVGNAAGGSTPIFNLTRSKKFQHDKQQYVIFVTPEIINSAGAATESITQKFRLNAGER